LKKWLIACDESGVHRAEYYGWGTLWLPEQRRGDFTGLLGGLRTAHNFPHEFKWSKVNRYNAGFALDVVRAFFRTSWLHFHCLVVPRTKVDLARHKNLEQARLKHFTMLLTTKIERVVRAHGPAGDQSFRIWVDPLPSSYAKADEAVEIIANRVLKKVFGEVRPIDAIITKDSKDTDTIQLCDLLLGGVMDGWQRASASAPKRQVRCEIAKHLGWADVDSDTHVKERKFNIWYFHDPRHPRQVQTRPVTLVHPLPPLRAQRP
jgi:hypothetical protein